MTNEDSQKVSQIRRNGIQAFMSRGVRSVLRGTFLSKIRRHVMRLPWVSAAVCGFIRAVRPICRDRVLFASFAGDCSCNPRAIAEALSRLRPRLDIVWWVDPFAAKRLGRDRLPAGGRVVEQWTLRGLVALVTAGVQVENAQVFESKGMPRKRKGQFRLNTWHGSLGIKRLDTAGRTFDERLDRLRQETDAVLLNSSFEDEVFEEALFSGTRRLRFGHPRNDVFFLPERGRAALRRRVCDELGLDSDERLALYAPTFRAEGFFTAAATCDFASWSSALSSRFGGQWRVVVRLHPMDRRVLRDGLFVLPPGLTDVSGYEDMSALQVAADVGITDYSSWIFDYLLGGRPGFLFAPDKARYASGRGLYYPLESTPFPVAEDERGLLANIMSFDTAAFVRARERFLQERGCFERGDASERTANEILRVLDGGVAR